MKKSIKIIIGIVVVFLLTIVIDLICIFTINRPIFVISEDYGNYAIYKGLFFNTYNCSEYSIPQIKGKGIKFNCANIKLEEAKIIDIIDKTKEINNFTCDSALELFYQDDTYNYYYSCIKSKYIVVKYESGYEEEVKNALKRGIIKISDLDKYSIDYIKYEKEVNNDRD